MLTNAALAKKVVIERLSVPARAILGLLANPYLMLVMPGPNKEISLMFLTLLFADAMLRSERRWSLACACYVPMYLLRDGYGLFMIGMIITHLAVRPARAPSPGGCPGADVECNCAVVQPGIGLTRSRVCPIT
jgi:hypothetical protein